MGIIVWSPMIRAASLLLLVIVAGCATPTVDAQRFGSLTQRRGLGHLYYTGTKGDFHYFAESYFLEPIHHYKLPVSAYTITNTFPKTGDQTLWIPWQVSLNSGTEGFRGEQVQPLTTQQTGRAGSIELKSDPAMVDTAIAIGMTRTETLQRLQKYGAIEVAKDVLPSAKGWSVAGRSECLFLSFTNDILAGIWVERNADKPKIDRSWYTTNSYILR